MSDHRAALVEWCKREARAARTSASCYSADSPHRAEDVIEAENLEAIAHLLSASVEAREPVSAEVTALRDALKEAKHYTHPASEARQKIEAVLAASQSLEAVSPWQPIATAPHGPEVLVFDEGAILISLWVEGIWDNNLGQMVTGWWDNGIIDPPPTHWMPLPAPPESREIP